MTMLVKRNGGLKPSVFSDLMDTERFFNSDFDLFDTGIRMPSSWVPSVNIEESPKDFKVTLAAPGLKKDDFKIKFENDMLTISAEKKEESKEENKRFTRREYFYGSFERSFSLPEGVNGEKIDAHYENGILSLTLPKKEEWIKKSKVKEIPVH